MGNYGTDSEAWGYMGNRDGACDYDDMNNRADIEAYKVLAIDNIIRGNKEETNDPLNYFGAK